MEVVVTTGAIRRAKLQSSRHHQQTNTLLFTGRMPFLSPNQQCQSTEGKPLWQWKYRVMMHIWHSCLLTDIFLETHRTANWECTFQCLIQCLTTQLHRRACTASYHVTMQTSLYRLQEQLFLAPLALFRPAATTHYLCQGVFTLFVYLSLLATSHKKNYWSDLRDNFTSRDGSLNKEVTSKFRNHLDLDLGIFKRICTTVI